MRTLPLSLLCLVALPLGACQPLTNKHDRLILACGDDVADAPRVVRIAGEDGAALDAAGFDAVLVQNSHSERVGVSSKGCVGLPKTSSGFLAARSRAGDRGLLIPLNQATLPSPETPLRLEKAPAQFLTRNVSPACSDTTSVSKELPFRLNGEESTRLNFLRLATRVESDSDKGQRSVAAPVSLETGDTHVSIPDDLPEGRYRLVIDLENVFDRAAGLKTQSIVCPFQIDRTPPAVDLTAADGGALGLSDRAPDLATDVAPGQALTFTVRDASATDVFYCFAAQAEDGPAAPCTGDFKAVNGSIYAPDKGVWTLHYYTRDAAGHQTSPAVKTLAVVHDDAILRLEAELRNLETAVASHQVFEAYPSLFDALGIYGDLSLERERRPVRDHLTATLLKLGPRLSERQRYDNRSGESQKIAYNRDGSALGVLSGDGELDWLEENGARRAVYPDVANFWLAGDGTSILVKHAQAGSVTRIDSVTGQQRLLMPATSEALASADGRVVVAHAGSDVVVIDTADGHELARSAFPAGADSIAAVSRHGHLVIFHSGETVSAWAWPDHAFFPPLSAGSGTCAATTLAVDAEEHYVFVGMQDTSSGAPALAVTGGTTACGLRRWNPATGSSELLSYLDGQQKEFTPNGTSQLEVSEDGQKLFAINDGLSWLLAWNGGQLQGTFKELAPQGQSGMALALSNTGRIAASTSTGELRVFDQRQDFIRGENRPARDRFANLGMPLLKLALHPTAPVVAGTDRQGRVRFFRLQEHIFRTVPTSAPMQTPRLLRMADGQTRVVYLTDAVTIALSDSGTTKEVQLVHPEPVSDMALSSDGHVISAAGQTLRIFDATGQLRDEQAASGPVTRLFLAGSVLVAQTQQQLEIWSLKDGALIPGVRLAAENAQASLNRDGSRLAVLNSANGRLELRALPEGRLVAANLPYAMQVSESLPLQPFSPDGHQVLSVEGESAAVLAAEDGAVLRRVPLAAADPDASGVVVVRMSASGLLVLSGSHDRKDFVRLDEKGRVAARFSGFRGALERLDVLSDADVILGKGKLDDSAQAWAADGHLLYQLGDADFPAFRYAATADGGDFVTLDIRNLRLAFWPVRSIADAQRDICSELEDAVRTRPDDWAVRARQLCGFTAP